MKLRQKQIIIKVTDHALLRYLQRVRGYDIEAIKEQVRRDINNPKIIEQYLQIGDGGKYPVNDEYYAVIQGRKVVTILPT